LVFSGSSGFWFSSCVVKSVRNCVKFSRWLRPTAPTVPALVPAAVFVAAMVAMDGPQITMLSAPGPARQ
jgi:hypothetical protein